MSFAKILAPLTGGPRDAAVLATAFAAAKPFAAHVEALFVRPDPAEAMPFFGDGVSGAVLQEIVDVAKEASDKAVEQVRATLAAEASAAGAEVVDAPVPKHEGISASLRELSGNFADRLTAEARLCDLVVFGPLREGDRAGLMEAFEAVLLDTGRPVLLTAERTPASIGTRVAIGCDGTVASAHAVTAALPFLRRAETVALFTVKRGEEKAGVCAEVKDYLALHGVDAREKTVEPGARAAGEAILDAAVQCGADLLVLGGYAQSRLKQTLFGSVTRHVVSHAQLPLFLVH
jgi:nucleotide-binding universal stress UspA family protein